MNRLGVSFDDRLDVLLARLGRLPVIRAVLCRLRGHDVKMDAGGCIRCGLTAKIVLRQLRKERTR